MLKKYLYPIVKNKKLKNWLKFWYLQGQKVAIKLIKLLDVTSPVTLNNTIKDTHIKIDILGNTSQDGTPTPENEVPIHVVKGHNEFKIANADDTEFQTLELDLPSGMEMCGLGNYKDTFEKVDRKWYKSKNVFKYTFTGTESWIYRKDQGHDRFDIIFVENLIMGESGTNLMLSTYFKSKFAIENQVIFISRTDNYISVIFDGKVLSTFEEWLTTHNLVVYCVLSTPTLEEITDSTLISQLDAMQNAKAYDEQTNIIITAEDLEPKLNIEYLEKEVIT